MSVRASRGSRKRLDVRLPGLAFRPDEIRQELNGLVAADAKLDDDPRVHRGALADAQLRILAVVGLELHLSLEDVEGLGPPVRVRRGAPVHVHRDVAERVDELLVRRRSAQVVRLVRDSVAGVGQRHGPLSDRAQRHEVPELIVVCGVDVIELADDRRDPCGRALVDEGGPLAVLPRELMAALVGVHKAGPVRVRERRPLLLAHFDEGHVRHAPEHLRRGGFAKLDVLADPDELRLLQWRRALARAQDRVVRRSSRTARDEEQRGEQGQEALHRFRLTRAAARPQTTSAPLTAAQTTLSATLSASIRTSEGKKRPGSGRTSRPRYVKSAPAFPLSRMSTARSYRRPGSIAKTSVTNADHATVAPRSAKSAGRARAALRIVSNPHATAAARSGTVERRYREGGEPAAPPYAMSAMYANDRSAPSASAASSPP